MLRLALLAVLALVPGEALAFRRAVIRPAAGARALGSLVVPRVLPRSPPPHACAQVDEEDRLPWRSGRELVQRAVLRSGVFVRTVGQKIVVLLFSLMICFPLSSGYAIALTLPAEPAAIGAPASPRYYDQDASSPLATEMNHFSRFFSSKDGKVADGMRRKTSFVTTAVQAVVPAVVRIDTERLVDRPALEGYLTPGGMGPDGQRREAGQGSGVILSEDGLIMTNAHVVKNAAKVQLLLFIYL